MANEGKRSKGRFLYLFDWNSKSRKKLFSNKSEPSEVSNQGKENVDNVANSQHILREMRENGDHLSFRGSDNYSCVSSINGDDGYGARAPGVVARLMGLDTMPTTTPYEASYISSYEAHAVNSSFYSMASTSFQPDRHMMDYGYAPTKPDAFPWNFNDSRTRKIHGRPIERFQTEVLPPKSAKPISITHHRLLSPIKSPGFIPSKDAAYIMEAASRIIDSGPTPTARTKISSLGSPSSSFRIQDVKDRIDAAQRLSRLNETPKTPKHVANMQLVEGTPSNRSSHRSLFRNIIGSETSSSHKARSKGKSKSVPAQDKVGVQIRENLPYTDSRSRLQKESKKDKLKQKESNAYKEPNTQNARAARASRQKTSGVLRQNSGKQNSACERDKQTSKSSFSDKQTRKIVPGDNSARPSKIVNRVFVNAESDSKKPVATSKVTEKRPPKSVTEKRPSLNRMNNISRIKQGSARGDRLGENVPANCGERAVQRDPSLQDDSRTDTDVISFTFTSPIKKSLSQSLSFNESSGTNYHCAESTDHGQCQTRNSSSPPFGSKLIDSGSLSRLLEQKLQELTDKIGSSKSDSMVEGPDNDSVSCLSKSISSHGVLGTDTLECDDWSDKDQESTVYDDDCSSSVLTRSSQKWEDFEGVEEHGVNVVSNGEPYRESDLGYLNTSIPECSVSGSWMSSSTSDFTNGYDQPSSPQSQEVISGLSTGIVLPREDETDFADVMSYWELEYVRYVLHYAGLKSFSVVDDCKIIDPGLFELLENLINTSVRSSEQCSMIERRILFDCVVESVSTKYGRAFFGSYKAWAKWGMMLQNEWLTEEVYKEVMSWQSMGNLMVDELVDWDMSTQYGKWVNFEIESLEEGMLLEEEIVASLVDELVADLSVQILSR